jgi:hypothetical protein
MEGVYDDDIHREAGYENWEDYINDRISKLDVYDYCEEESNDSFDIVSKYQMQKEYLRSFILKKCTMKDCQGNFILRINKHQKSFFWGCSSYPMCKSTSSLLANNKTMIVCPLCKSICIVDKIFSMNQFSLVCQNEFCNYSKTVSIDDFNELIENKY